jgi:magnesium-transporting ATPase (P-type)
MSSNKLEAEKKQEDLQKNLLKKIDTSKFIVHKMTVADAAGHLKTDLKKGLSTQEVEKRLVEHGTNELDEE